MEHQAFHVRCNNQQYILFDFYFCSMLENEIQDMENNLTREVRVLEALPTTSDAKGKTIYNKIEIFNYQLCIYCSCVLI